MANTSKINGFRLVKNAVGVTTGKMNIYAHAAGDGTTLFVGDPVVLAGSADAQGIATVTRAAQGAAVLGVVVGVLSTKLDPVAGTMTAGSIALDTPQYVPASTAQYVLVCDDPSAMYEVEASTGDAAAYSYALADTGLNADMTAPTTKGSTTTGTSNCSLDMATKATTATLQFKILGVVQRPDNEKTGNYTKVIVKINNASLGGGTGATGQ